MLGSKPVIKEDIEMTDATETPASEVIPTKSPPLDNIKQDPNAINNKDEKPTNGTSPPAAEVKDDSKGTATIEIKGFSRIREKKYYTEPVEICGLKWRLLVFPHGNDVDHLSLYLDFCDGKAHGPQFQRDARFTLEVVNQLSPKDSVRRNANHVFKEEASDWGFTQFMKLSQLQDQRLGFMKEDKLVVNVEVELIKDERQWYWSLDSKKETGYVGLKNQGATCYMNSLLQALYNVPYFRRAVYQLPTDNEVATKSVQLALQRIFYRLQFGSTSVGTKELTKSFGWTAVDSFTQHDVQELDRVLLDNLQTKMKGTKAEGTIENMFQGKIKNFIKCVDIDFESNREEAYFDLSLNVKGCTDVMQSFEKYVEVEMLDGNNKYHAEGHGLQVAKMGCTFLSFPSTLHLQLKRFEYDPMRDAMVKVNDKYMFPETLDLSKFMSDDADKSSPPIFHFHGVLVHSGDVHGGHYYAFIRPTTKPEWFKFDDERVTKATIQQVTEDNFGGEEEYAFNLHGRRTTQVHKKFSNAYMLVYLRASDVTKLLAPIPDTDIPVHLKEKFDKEEVLEEAKKKEKAEAHLYMILKVATDADFRLGRKSDLIDFDRDRVNEFRVKKTSTIKDFKKQAAEFFDIPPDRQRYWGWVSRQNKTFRPDVPLTAHEEETPLEEVAKHAPKLRLYLEASTAPESSPAFSTLHDDDILIFFKHYDPSRELLHYVGHAIVKTSVKPPNLMPLMNSFVGQPPNTPLLVFEEVKPNMIEAKIPNLTLRESEITNGDILVFQRTPELREAPATGLASVPEYYDYILNRVTVKFRRLDQPKKDAFTLELSKKMLYDQVTARIAAKIGTDPSKIRLTAHNSQYDIAKPSPLKRQERMTLNDMLSTYYKPTTDTLFFESLDVPVAELENKKALRVSFHSYKPETCEALSLLLPRDATMGDVLTMIKGLVKLDPEHGSGKLRLMEVWTYKIHKVLHEEEPITSLNDYAKLRAEEIPKEELHIDDNHKRLHVAHFHKDYGIVQPHSNPFYQVVPRDETLSKFKHRIAARLGVTDEEVAKWRFAIVSFGKPEYLQDTDLVAKYEYAHTDYLGLEHPDTSSTRLHRPSEKSIKILG